MRNARIRTVLGTLVVALFATACASDGGHDVFAGYTPHERYEHGLRTSGLDVTALGRDWLAAASRALEAPVRISPPYNEVSYMDAAEAGAVGYRVSLARGQKISANFELEGDSAYHVFLDMFVMPTGARTSPILLASADTGSHEVEYVARRDGDYIVRIQPELLRGGRYSLTVEVGGSLGFPVAEYDHSAVRSFWGDWRSGGRLHEGVDIFAPRGTPVIAATSGTVRSTRPNKLGGNVVWLNDELGRSQYYAHLDSFVVARGDRVEAGDTLGFVGNTGNARTTPPHLHFGLTSRGWFDPSPALGAASAPAVDFAGDHEVIGSTMRVNADRTRVRVLPASRSNAVASVARHTPLSVVAGSGRWYRVSLPDGAIGFVEARFLESADQPIRSELLATGTLLRTSPMLTAAATDSLVAGQQVPVLGAYGDFLLVQAPSGRAGWLVID
jgi:murein DD-endopeptidase MepM/ murein hydrolase activator NlpD